MDLNIKGLFLTLICTSVRKVTGSFIELPARTQNLAPDGNNNNMSINTNTSSYNKGHPVFAPPQEQQPIYARPPKKYIVFAPIQGGNARLFYMPRNTTLNPLSNNYQWHQPMFEHAIWSFTLTVYVKGSYPSMLNNPSSPTYQTYATAFKQRLVLIYGDYEGFKGLTINGFFKGSIACKFTLKGNTDFQKQVFDKTKSDYRDVNITVDRKIYAVESNKTASAIATEMLASTREDRICSALQNVCPYDTLCSWSNSSGFVCIHKCATKNPCSHDGECYVNTEGTVKCRCKEDSTLVYKGDTCEEEVFKFFSKNNTYIFNTCEFAVIIGLIVLIICLIARNRRRQTGKPNSPTLPGTAEVHRNTSRMENEDMDIILETPPGQRPIPEQERRMYPAPQLYPRLADYHKTAVEAVQNNRPIPRQGRLMYPGRQAPMNWTGNNMAAEEFVQNRYRY
ncbi:interphotoreceptor matrix proteoglycan 2-like [Mizuhopecten yessoensis]|uniref:Interphotoreceptor matrix proteoglycan 2 n=1 Tax=Mizuhopecten yessoensis TaxID=6573 RepID=A0A210Q120_MIZYE|nr:interphotoreceptor matrix proteoglycan 2-like [Mizuhopecten yessoensis]OWF42422.1 Interphotoreceptor matrix proteoglycan 2 [Mizuhopecten yessoensis]